MPSRQYLTRIYTQLVIWEHYNNVSKAAGRGKIKKPLAFCNRRMTSSTYYDRIKLFEEMEKRFEKQDEQYFRDLLSHDDSVVRTRAVCILADIAGENAVEPIGRVLKHDKNDLVRHEAAFSLGQLGFTSGITALADAVKHHSNQELTKQKKGRNKVLAKG